MYARPNKSKINKNKAVAAGAVQTKHNETKTTGLVDNRPENLVQSQLFELTRNNSATGETLQLEKTDKEKAKERAKKSWETRRLKLNEAVVSVNKKIIELDKKKTNFYEAFTDVPANIRVKILDLGKALDVQLNKEKSQLANFSYSVLMYTKHSGKKSPEIQTALVNLTNSITKENTSQIFLSGNNDKTNKFLKKNKETTLPDFYKNNLRPDHIRRKRKLYGKFKKKIFKKKKMRKAILSSKVAGVSLRDWRRTSNGSYSSGKVVYDSQVIKGLIGSELVYKLHKKIKKEDSNKRMKSARAFKISQKNKALVVPDNKKNIHAESAILTALKKLDAMLVAIGGTKVACVACQAFFQDNDMRKFLGDETSFAWLSKSSLEQLGIPIGETAAYLLKIKEILNSELKKLKFYDVSDGTIKTAEMTMEDDKTDSEDEEAMVEEIIQDDETEEEINQITSMIPDMGN